MIAIWLVGVALALLFGSARAYGLAIGSGRNARLTVPVGVAFAGAAVLATGGAAWAWRYGSPWPLWVVLGLSGVVVLAAALVFGINAIGRVPTRGIRIRVGDRLPEFEALTADGERWSSASVAGERVLLKFFRGEWCPFCQAELKRFNAMEAALSARGVRVIGISKDTPEVARRHRERDGLRFTLLCDPDLTVIRQFGLEHRRSLEISEGPRLRLFGLSMASRPAIRHMAAPTTVLIDANGIIRFIDQTEDYKIRSSPARVLGATDEAFGLTPRDGDIAERLAPEPDELGCADC